MSPASFGGTEYSQLSTCCRATCASCGRACWASVLSIKVSGFCGACMAAIWVEGVQGVDAVRWSRRTVPKNDRSMSIYHGDDNVETMVGNSRVGHSKRSRRPVPSALRMTVENKYKIIRSSQTGSSGDGGSSSKWDEALPGIGRMVYFNQISRPARRGEIAIKSTRLSKRMMGGPADAMGPSRRINKRGGRDLVVGKALWRACSVVG